GRRRSLARYRRLAGLLRLVGVKLGVDVVPLGKGQVDDCGVEVHVWPPVVFRVLTVLTLQMYSGYVNTCRARKWNKRSAAPRRPQVLARLLYICRVKPCHGQRLQSKPPEGASNLLPWWASARSPSGSGRTAPALPSRPLVSAWRRKPAARSAGGTCVL